MNSLLINFGLVSAVSFALSRTPTAVHIYDQKIPSESHWNHCQNRLLLPGVVSLRRGRSGQSGRMATLSKRLYRREREFERDGRCSRVYAWTRYLLDLDGLENPITF